MSFHRAGDLSAVPPAVHHATEVEPVEGFANAVFGCQVERERRAPVLLARALSASLSGRLR
jgi:hypothetical protein